MSAERRTAYWLLAGIALVIVATVSVSLIGCILVASAFIVGFGCGTANEKDEAFKILLSDLGHNDDKQA